MEKRPDKQSREPRLSPLVSAILPDGTMLEMLYRPALKNSAEQEPQTLFIVAPPNGEWHEAPEIVIGSQLRRPYSARNNLLANGVVLLPSHSEEFTSEADLLQQVHAFLHRYVDLSADFLQITAHYILFTWLHDAFSDLPYLRVRGDFGSGKTRFLLVAGALCYKPIFASGASTISPLFRILDAFRGTLIIDEGDFRASDERADVVKILNNGTTRGFPVLRSEVLQSGEYDPRAYHVFGPKLVATRSDFEDPALESRFLTEDMGSHPLRTDVPLNLPPGFASEATSIRNKLLTFRLRTWHNRKLAEGVLDKSLEPRLNQVLIPLWSSIASEEGKQALVRLAKARHWDLLAERSEEPEALVLIIIRDLLAAEEPRIAVKQITNWFIDRHGEDFERRVTPRWIGSLIRRKLRLRTQKVRGTYCLVRADFGKLPRLYERYGLIASHDAAEAEVLSCDEKGDVGDFSKKRAD